MEFKKYIIVWVLWLLLTLWLWIFVFKEHYESNKLNDSNFSYIPSNFSQVFHINFDDNLYWFLDEAPDDIYGSQNIVEISDGLNSVTAYQWSLDWSDISFMIFDVQDDFDFQNLLDSWFLYKDWDYVYENISNNKYIYIKESLLDLFLNYTWKSMDDLSSLSSYIQDLKSSKKNIWLFSEPNVESITQTNFNSIFPYLDDLGYTISTARLSNKDFDWSISVLFDENIDLFQDYEFESKYSDNLLEDTIAYLEVWSITDLIWTDSIWVDLKTLIMSIELSLEEYFWDLWLWLTDSNYSDLWKSLSSNIWLVVNKWNNEMGVWARIIFDDIWVYNVLDVFFPFIVQFIEDLDIEWEISKFTWDNEFWINFNIPYVWLVALESNIIVSNDWERTYIDILEPKLDSESIDFDYNKSSILSYYLNLSNLFDIMYPVGWFQEFWFTKEQFEFFQDKKVFWNLDIDWNKIIFNFNLKN